VQSGLVAGPRLMLGQRLQQQLDARRDGRAVFAQQGTVQLLLARGQVPHLARVARPAEHLLHNLRATRARTPLARRSSKRCRGRAPPPQQTAHARAGRAAPVAQAGRARRAPARPSCPRRAAAPTAAAAPCPPPPPAAARPCSAGRSCPPARRPRTRRSPACERAGVSPQAKRARRARRKEAPTRVRPRAARVAHPHPPCAQPLHPRQRVVQAGVVRHVLHVARQRLQRASGAAAAGAHREADGQRGQRRHAPLRRRRGLLQAEGIGLAGLCCPRHIRHRGRRCQGTRHRPAFPPGPKGGPRRAAARLSERGPAGARRPGRPGRAQQAGLHGHVCSRNTKRRKGICAPVPAACRDAHSGQLAPMKMGSGPC